MTKWLTDFTAWGSLKKRKGRTPSRRVSLVSQSSVPAERLTARTSDGTSGTSEHDQLERPRTELASFKIFEMFFNALSLDPLRRSQVFRPLPTFSPFSAKPFRSSCGP